MAEVCHIDIRIMVAEKAPAELGVCTGVLRLESECLVFVLSDLNTRNQPYKTRSIQDADHVCGIPCTPLFSLTQVNNVDS